MERRLLRITEVSKILDVKVDRVYTMAREGLLLVVRLGRQIRVDKIKLNQWIDNGEQALPGVWKRTSKQVIRRRKPK
ncbi:DNA binding domain-containing protein, excisionase family [Seinonella peptonophila]|uniref:DNA binding domain-containing protein, excisionase family n=1 Tax=Seinonella peptonophila TaxID=112248 RepID=A0A1M4YNY2_9BACL|nr:helix-turn-helix domain-containing protein [Seinonella peptonophila]SHF07441.1 DNA binding domain-containing protein, excisionase family [Seinonella peptonophila]